jgi:hypothetical protein
VSSVAYPLLTVGLVALVYARRRFRAEAATILIVALPLVLSLPYNAPNWYRSLRAHQRLSTSEALAIAPPVIAGNRNLPLAQQALSSIPQNGTYALIAPPHSGRKTGAARRERARRTYVASWLQYWLAPRLQVDSAEAEWWILLDAPQPPEGVRAVFRFGDDLLVQRS